MEFLGLSLFKVLMSSTAVVALITSGCNYFSILKTNVRLLDIEDKKAKSEKEIYRYTHIFDTIKKISVLPSVDYNYLRKDENGYLFQDDELLRKVIENASDRYGKIKEMYDLVSPLIDPTLKEDAERAVSEAERLSNLLTTALYTDTVHEEDVSVAALMEARRNAESIIKKTMQRQVSVLTLK